MEVAEGAGVGRLCVHLDGPRVGGPPLYRRLPPAGQRRHRQHAERQQRRRDAEEAGAHLAERLDRCCRRRPPRRAPPAPRPPGREPRPPVAAQQRPHRRGGEHDPKAQPLDLHQLAPHGDEDRGPLLPPPLDRPARPVAGQELLSLRQRHPVDQRHAEGAEGSGGEKGDEQGRDALRRATPSTRLRAGLRQWTRPLDRIGAGRRSNGAADEPPATGGGEEDGERQPLVLDPGHEPDEEPRHATPRRSASRRSPAPPPAPAAPRATPPPRRWRRRRAAGRRARGSSYPRGVATRRRRRRRASPRWSDAASRRAARWTAARSPSAKAAWTSLNVAAPGTAPHENSSHATGSPTGVSPFARESCGASRNEKSNRPTAATRRALSPHMTK